MNIIEHEKYKKLNIIGVSECGEIFDSNLDFVTSEVLELAVLAIIDESAIVDLFDRKFKISVEVIE